MIEASTVPGCSIKLSITGLDQWSVRISALSLRARKAVQDSERAAPGDLENRPGAVGTIIQGRTVEVSVGALDDATLRRTAIRRGKAVQHGGRLSVNLVDRSQGVAAAKIGVP